MERTVFDHADARAARTGDSLMLSEFGATDDIPLLERMAGEADRHMVSWQEWHYCGCDDPTTSGPGDIQAIVKDPGKPPRGSNVFWGKLKALARPYPQAIAGTPIRWSFDPDDPPLRAGLHDQAGRRAGPLQPGHGRLGRGTSQVFVPRIQYPNGYGFVVNARPETSGQRLLIHAGPNARRIKLVITPR